MRLTSPFVALISGVAIPTILNVLYGMCGQWLGGAISRQSWEPSSRGAGYQGASTPIKTVKRMINWFILCAVWRVGDQADYFGGWGLLCLKLSGSSYHNLGESSPTNILFVPKYKSQSRLVLCSKMVQSTSIVVPELRSLALKKKSTPFSPLLYLRLFSHNKDQYIYSYLKWRMEIA